MALANFAEQVLDRHLAIVQDEGAGGRSANAHFVLFGADGKSRKSSFDQERGKLFAVNFCEHREQVGEARVGNPHLLAVEDVVLAVGRKHGTGAAIEGVGTRTRFRQGVRAHNFSRGQTRQVLLLLLFGAEINDGQQANAAVGAPGGGKPGVLGNVVGDDGGGDFVHFQAAVGFGNFNSAEAEVAGFLQQVARDREILVFDFIGLRQDFVVGKLFGGLPDHLLLFGKIFGSEDIGSLPLFEQKAAAGNLGFRDCSRRHFKPLLSRNRQVRPRRSGSTLEVYEKSGRASTGLHEGARSRTIGPGSCSVIPWVSRTSRPWPIVQ